MKSIFRSRKDAAPPVANRGFGDGRSTLRCPIPPSLNLASAKRSSADPSSLMALASDSPTSSSDASSATRPTFQSMRRDDSDASSAATIRSPTSPVGQVKGHGGGVKFAEGTGESGREMHLKIKEGFRLEALARLQLGPLGRSSVTVTAADEDDGSGSEEDVQPAGSDGGGLAGRRPAFAKLGLGLGDGDGMARWKQDRRKGTPYPREHSSDYFDLGQDEDDDED